MVDPRQYRRGFGIRGWWINCLNRLRVFIEKRVALHILVIECKKVGRTDVKEIKNLAEKDPSFIPKAKTEPFRERRTFLRDKFPVLFETNADRTESRYRTGRANSDVIPDRPIPIEEGMARTIAEHEKRNSRELRYFAGRRFQVVSDGEDE